MKATVAGNPRLGGPARPNGLRIPMLLVAASESHRASRAMFTSLWTGLL